MTPRTIAAPSAAPFARTGATRTNRTSAPATTGPSSPLSQPSSGRPSNADRDGAAGARALNERRPSKPAPAVPRGPVKTAPGSAASSRRPEGSNGKYGPEPGVIRTVVPKADLERDPRLAGQLDAPPPSEPPEGVTVREDDDGTRVVSINVHGGVPVIDGGSEEENDLHPRNEDIAALRDIAAYVRGIDADVVLVQEVRDRAYDEPAEGEDQPEGITHQASVLYHLLDADDMAFTPSQRDEAEFDNFGTAVYTRNGYSIDRAASVDIPRKGGKESSVGVAAIVPPSGSGDEPFTVINAHNSAGKDFQDLRTQQLEIEADVAEQIGQDGSFTYTGDVQDSSGAWVDAQLSASGFPTNVVLGGDLNQVQDNANGKHDSPDEVLGDAGLRHALDSATAGADLRTGRDGTIGDRRIDHIYLSPGLAAASVSVGWVPSVEIADDDKPTDHASVVVDVHSAPTGGGGGGSW